MSLQIGRVILGEADMRPFEETWSSDERTVTLTGEVHRGTVAQLTATHDDLLGLGNSLVGVSFGTKTHRNGFYTVMGAKSSLIHLGGEQVVRVEWEVNLRREGSVSEVELETRFAGPLTRANDHTLTGNRWSAPPIDHTAFWAGSDSPGVVNRVAEEGTIKVYTGMPITRQSVRYAADPLTYDLGGARVLDNGLERSGTGVTLGSAWELSNSLVGASWSGNDLVLHYYAGGSWKTKLFRPQVDTANLPAPEAISVLYNQLERVTLRLVWGVSSGRVTADITVRRGARYIDVVMKKPVASTMSVGPSASVASAAFTGGYRPTANDADGNRYVLGSARSFTGNSGTGVISKSATARFDFMLGLELGGTAAVAGDTGAELLAQYLGSPSESIQAVKR